MKYFIGGIVGGVLAVINSLFWFLLGAVFATSVGSHSTRKVAPSEYK